MKNTTLTIAILMSIAGNLYMPAFGMDMGTMEIELERPARTRLIGDGPAQTCLEKNTRKVTKACDDAGKVCVEITKCGVTAASCGLCLSMGCGCDPATAIIAAMLCGTGTLCCDVLHTSDSNNRQ